MKAIFVRCELSLEPSIQLTAENQSDALLLGDMFEDNDKAKIDYAISEGQIIIFKIKET